MESPGNRNPGGTFSGTPAGGEAAARRATATSEEASFLAPIERVVASLKRMASNYATLTVLDLRRAAVQFAWLVGAGILICVLVVTAWLAAVVALAVWLLGEGLSWPAVLLVAAAINLVGAGLVLMAAEDDRWRIEYTRTGSGWPTAIRLQRTAGEGAGRTDVVFAVDAPEAIDALPAAALTLDVPAGTRSVSVADLRTSRELRER